ncbi:MAG: hypothetical protein U0V72_04860 [Cytophagales bacterium]
MNKVSNYQKIILLVITAINIATGFIRYNSVINFLDLDQLVFKRNKLKFSYPHNLSSFIDSLIMDPRWLSNIYYFLIAVLSTYITARILFGKEKSVLVLYCYSILILICILLVMVTLITHEYKLGMSPAQELKNIAQSPLFSFTILGLLYYSNIDRKSASE